MRVKKEHLRKRGKITLYIPQEDIPFIESLIERYPEVSFSELVLRSLKEKYGKRKNLLSLGGSLKAYQKDKQEDMEEILTEVAKNAAQEGITR